MASKLSDELRSAALAYHRNPRPGKISVEPTKPLVTQRDLSLAYTPGVAAACEAIVADPLEAAQLTLRGNLVAVITNGTAVLGLGAIGPLAGKPVMEGKGVLFKKFANIDVFDIEVEARDVDRFCDVVSALEPTFGGINLEDIKAPECFEIETRLRQCMNIPVFHDDQHGTAIIVGAAVKNAMILARKSLPDVKIVTSGAGAAAIACLNLLVLLGAKRENIWATDLEGVVYEGREAHMDPWKAVFAQVTHKRTLDEVIDGADVFLGLSAGGVLKPEMVARMAAKPLIMALANPTPEILPEEVHAVRDDAMICTGRSDYPNQVNNVLCFPYMFRGALDVLASEINEAMKLAAVDAIAALAQDSTSDIAAAAYGGATRLFGPDYLIPYPFDPRLIVRIAPAVARAAVDTGVAKRPMVDFDSYIDRLDRFIFRSGTIMKPVVSRAHADPRRVVYADGEDDRVLRAAQLVIEEGIAQPTLIGRPDEIEQRLKREGLRIRAGRDFELINPEDDPRYKSYVETYLGLTCRRGVTPDTARRLVRTNPTIIAALAVYRGEADAMLCGLEGRYSVHLGHVRDVIGLASGVHECAAMSLIILNRGAYFLADTHVADNPDADDLAEIAMLAAAQVRRFGIEPKVALLSHSSFGGSDRESARKMRRALEKLRERDPDLEAEGEMRGDAALDVVLRDRVFPSSRLQGEANVLVMPSLDAANISYTLLKTLGDALSVGPMLLGTARPAHILTSSTSSRGIYNMTALSVVDAQDSSRRRLG